MRLKHAIITTASLLSFSSYAYAIDAKLLVENAARIYGVPVTFAMQVAQHESHMRCGKVGSGGEVGPLQIKPATSRQIGLPVTRRSSCAEQVNAGMKHLSLCLKGARGDHWRAATCHNAGLGSLDWKRPPKAAQRYANAVLNRVTAGLSKVTRSARAIRIVPAKETGARYITNFKSGVGQ